MKIIKILTLILLINLSTKILYPNTKNFINNSDYTISISLYDDFDKLHKKTIPPHSTHKINANGNATEILFHIVKGPCNLLSRIIYKESPLQKSIKEHIGSSTARAPKVAHPLQYENYLISVFNHSIKLHYF